METLAENPPVVAVVTAAGQGTRLGAAGPKALVPVGEQAMVARAVAALASYPQLVAGVVTAPASHIGEFSAVLAGLDLPQPWQVVAGGEHRRESVFRGLQALRDYHPNHEYLCLIHDAARCLTPLAVVERVVQALKAGADAVVPALEVVDTIREIIPEEPEKMPLTSALESLPETEAAVPTSGASTLEKLPSENPATGTSATEIAAAEDAGAEAAAGIAEITAAESSAGSETNSSAGIKSSQMPKGSVRAGKTLNRDKLRAVQTPQGFPWEKIWQAHYHFRNSDAAWDDAMMVSALGGTQYFVPGDWMSFKITTKPDLELANLLLKAKN